MPKGFLSGLHSVLMSTFLDIPVEGENLQTKKKRGGIWMVEERKEEIGEGKKRKGKGVTYSLNFHHTVFTALSIDRPAWPVSELQVHPETLPQEKEGGKQWRKTPGVNIWTPHVHSRRSMRTYGHTHTMHTCTTHNKISKTKHSFLQGWIYMTGKQAPEY